MSVEAVGDSGASGHFLKRKARQFLVDLKPTVGPARVRVSTAKNGSFMYSTHVGYIPHPTLPRRACRAFIFEEASANLFSYVQLVRNGCTVMLEKKGVTITDAATAKVLDHAPLREDDKVFMHRWDILASAGGPPIGRGTRSVEKEDEQAHTLIHNLPACERARLWRDIFLGKPTATLLNAISKGWTKSFPGLSKELIRNNLPYHSVAQAAGHLDKTRKNRASTTTKKKPSSCVYALAGDDDEWLARCRASGMDGHLGKPVDLAELRRVVSELLGVR